MMKVSVYLTLLILLSGCASGRLDRLELRLDRIERNLSQIESGLQANDEDLKADIRKLYRATEKEIRSIRSKTDKFKVRQSSGTLLFEPTYVPN